MQNYTEFYHIFSIFSVCGVFSQSTSHLTFNAVLHGFLTLLQIFALILAMELRNYTEDFVDYGTKGWYDILNNYNENNPSTQVFGRPIKSREKICHTIKQYHFAYYQLIIS